MVENDVIRTAAGDLESNRSSSRTRWGIRIISVIGYVTHHDIVGSDEYDFAALIRAAENNSTTRRGLACNRYIWIVNRQSRLRANKPGHTEYAGARTGSF
jgi:hypothetical protein